MLNYVSKPMKLTRGKLRRRDEWSDWQKLEWMQLEQYKQQGMFGAPIPMPSKQTVFCLVWAYRNKVLDNMNKARCACNGSPCAGQVRILGHTYAGCIDHTTSQIFYAMSAAEGMMIYGWRCATTGTRPAHPPG